MNLIDNIGKKVNVWTKEGNAMEKRTLITADEMGVVVSPYSGDAVDVFVPSNRVKYIDLIKEKKPPSIHDIGPVKPYYQQIPCTDFEKSYKPPFHFTCETNGFADK